MEIWDLYDRDRRRTGKTHIRGELIPAGYYHLAVHVWIRNSKGEYLISKRSDGKKSYPGFWECTGGSALVGEESIDAALRECKEEVGVELDASRGRVVYSKFRDVVDGKIFRDLMDVWLFEYDGEVSLSRATCDEVSEVHWMSVERITELFESGGFVPTLEYFFTEVITR